MYSHGIIKNSIITNIPHYNSKLIIIHTHSHNNRLNKVRLRMGGLYSCSACFVVNSN